MYNERQENKSEFDFEFEFENQMSPYITKILLGTLHSENADDSGFTTSCLPLCNLE